MSKYPGNPWWHHENDVPIAILDEFAWNEAAAGGHLTAEHILQRLENILEFEFGRGAEMGLAADGFYNAKRIKAAAAQVLDLQSTLMERWSEAQASVQPSA
jgi:hypothetical protein